MLLLYNNYRGNASTYSRDTSCIIIPKGRVKILRMRAKKSYGRTAESYHLLHTKSTRNLKAVLL